MNNTPKIRTDDGKVAVLVSPGYGAGWSTWGSDRVEEMVFCPALATAVLNAASPQELREIAKQQFPDEYEGGAGELTVEWVPEGTRFYIDEYDGSERLVILGDDYRYVA